MWRLSSRIYHNCPVTIIHTLQLSVPVADGLAPRNHAQRAHSSNVQRKPHANSKVPTHAQPQMTLASLQSPSRPYFNRDTEVMRVWETPASGSDPTASAATPYKQARREHLVCESHVVCVCISMLRIMSPRAAHLVKDDRMTVGEAFRALVWREGACRV